MPWGILSHLWSTESKISAIFAVLIQRKQRSSTGPEINSSKLSRYTTERPQLLPLQWHSFVGQGSHWRPCPPAVPNGYMPISVIWIQKDALDSQLSESERSKIWKIERFVERFVCSCMLLAGFTHTHGPSRRKGNQFAPCSRSIRSYRYEYTHFVDPETGTTVCLSRTPSTALVGWIVGLQNEMTLTWNDSVPSL